MSTDEDRHLSDVHLHSAEVPGDGEAEAPGDGECCCTTSFAFAADDDGHDGRPASHSSDDEDACDEDGDLAPRRRKRPRPSRRSLAVRHSLATPLSDVGLQVWRGALLLGDWLLTSGLLRTAPADAG